jgi:hypothetical protein
LGLAANLAPPRDKSMAERLSADHEIRSAFIKTRNDFGIGCALPSLMKATRTSALTRTSAPRRTSCASTIEAPLTASGPGHDIEHIVHPGGPQEIHRHRAHHEGKARRLGFCFSKQRMLLGSNQPQMIGAPARHEAQIIGVIDDAGKHWLATIGTTERGNSLGLVA